MLLLLLTTGVQDPYAQETVGKQEPHLSGLEHTTGEAVYVDDMLQTQNEAYGVLVYPRPRDDYIR